ncbi:hypothetical protein, partial [Ralstonia pseudosolanacearum]|uniref:hypothetical protein n=1 Tax=Ralstonia pseudosolanacearum TaxID=1310165 RepID=UPI003CF325AD
DPFGGCKAFELCIKIRKNYIAVIKNNSLRSSRVSDQKEKVKRVHDEHDYNISVQFLFVAHATPSGAAKHLNCV